MKTGVLTITMAAAMVLTAASASARIGETVEQLDARFGAPKSVSKGEADQMPNSEARLYESKGFRILACIWNGHCHFEEYSPAEGELSRVQVDAILDANAFGSRWVGGFLDHSSGGWDLGGGRLNAIYSAMSGGRLWISTKEYDAASKANRQRSDIQRVAGF